MRNQNPLKSIGFLAADENGFQASGRLGDIERLARRLKPGKVKATPCAPCALRPKPTTRATTTVGLWTSCGQPWTWATVCASKGSSRQRTGKTWRSFRRVGAASASGCKPF